MHEIRGARVESEHRGASSRSSLVRTLGGHAVFAPSSVEFHLALIRGPSPVLYWIGAAGAPNGSAGAAAALTCHTVLAALVANDRAPVVPNDCGTAVE